MNTIINLNNEKNGIEVIFDAKPNKAVIDSLKLNGFKWSPKLKLWYAKQTPERLKFAESLGSVDASPAVAPVNSINMEGVGSKPYFGAGAELAKAIREEFKARGVKGCTVRVDHYDSITVTVKATPADMASIEEASERHSQFAFERLVHDYGVYGGNGWIYQSDLERMSEEEREGAYYKYLDYSIRKYNEFSYYHHEHNAHCWELTEAFYNKCLCILQIANQWNYDNSDLMSDYFDRGYYLTIAIKKADDFEPRATMTDEERKESESKPAFYFPAPIDEQINNIEIGDYITIYQCDGWILNNIYGGQGQVIDIRKGTWAQYEGMYIDLLDGRKTYSVFIRNNHQCLIYQGVKDKLPAHVTEEPINDHLSHMFNYEKLFPNVYNYYIEQGEKPLLDTWQR